MKINTKFAQNIFKSVFQFFFKILHGEIIGRIEPGINNNLEKILIKKDDGINYKLYKIKKGRLYTDRINDTAIIFNKKIVEGPSFQFRIANSQVINSRVEENIVFKKGTPRIKKKLKGKVLSLLTGGGGNNNYWHWLFDVLPRLSLCEDKVDLREMQFFLLPDNRSKFQLESLETLGISKEKQISSVNYRHIICDELYVTDHPVVRSDNATEDIQNIPKWISEWLKKNFLHQNQKKMYNKIYIDRGDSISNVSHLRSIINEDEVKKYLIKKNFTFLRLNELNFTDQVQHFNNADCIIGLHGAGFANLSFCNANTKVIEFRMSDTGKVIENLAKKNNLKFSSIICKPVSNENAKQIGHIKIPLNLLEEKMNNI